MHLPWLSGVEAVCSVLVYFPPTIPSKATGWFCGRKKGTQLLRKSKHPTVFDWILHLHHCILPYKAPTPTSWVASILFVPSVGMCLRWEIPVISWNQNVFYVPCFKRNRHHIPSMKLAPIQLDWIAFALHLSLGTWGCQCWQLVWKNLGEKISGTFQDSAMFNHLGIFIFQWSLVVLWCSHILKKRWKFPCGMNMTTICRYNSLGRLGGGLCPWSVYVLQNSPILFDCWLVYEQLERSIICSLEGNQNGW